MVDCLEDSHDMIDHEKHGDLHVLDVFEDDLLSTQMALLHPSADTSYVGTQKDTFGLKVA